MKLLVVLLVLCSGCAELLPAVSAGIDGATNVVKVACPQRTKPCETALNGLNASIVAYNGAVLADAVGEDAAPLAKEAMAQLKLVWASLKDLVSP